MRRRQFLAYLGGTAASWPIAARAQQPTYPVVGFLRNAVPNEAAHLVTAFRNGLSETGYAAMFWSNTVGRAAKPIVCILWPPIWSGFR